MKRPWIKWCLLVLVMLVALVGVPIIINECYKANDGYITLWGAADILSYYGMILAAAGAATGVFFSIKHSHKQYEEDRRNRILPYIAVTTLKQSAKYDVFDDAFEESAAETEYGYREYRLDHVFFVINENGIRVVSKLDNTQKQLLEHFGSMWVPNGPNGKAYIKKDMLSIPLDVENVGNGTAVNFRVGLNKKSTESLYMLPQALKQGRSMYIHIFSSTAYEKISGEYALEFFYEDIYGTHYCQKHNVTIGINSEKIGFSSIELYGKQEIIRGTQEDTTHADA